MNLNREILELASQLPRDFGVKEVAIASFVIGNSIDISELITSGKAKEAVRKTSLITPQVVFATDAFVNVLKEFTEINSEDRDTILENAETIVRSRLITATGLIKELINFGSITTDNVLPLLSATGLYSNELIVGLTQTQPKDVETLKILDKVFNSLMNEGNEVEETEEE